jgi:glutathione synthase/RimK-type ligase-like ATP-grasp enzyme
MTELNPGPDDSEPGFDLACRLDSGGQTEAAKQAYLAVLARRPTHFGALNNLGTLLYETGYRTAARTAYEEAVIQHPGNPMGHVNLANLLRAAGELAEARRHYETALRLQPGLAEAHRGIAYLLAELGQDEAAEEHRSAAYKEGAATVQRYRGSGPAIDLLLLVSAVGGNVPTSFLIDDRIFCVTALAASYVDPAATLPRHRLVFNAIGDADLDRPALLAAERLVARSTAPVINRPEAVLATGRAEIARRLAGLPGVAVPRIATRPRAALAGDDAAAILAEHGLSFPLLLRSPGFHTGRHFVRIETAAALRPALSALPGAALMAIQYLDARGGDGSARKYRVMIVDGRIYPLHLAISRDWKVHYFTADMAENAEHRAADAAFLADMTGTIGATALRGLEAIRDALGLDYGGIDFGIGRDGEVLLFEANATMVVNPPEPDKRWDYRRAPVERVLDAVRRMLARAARAP